MTQNADIDYGMGAINIDKDTGIRYGVISQHSISGEALSDFESYYGNATCPQCGTILKEFDEDHHYDYSDSDRRGCSCADFACETCEVFFDDTMSEYFYPDEPLSWYLEDSEYSAEFCLDSDIIIVKSPYFTYGQYCSPCVPGAVNLDSPLDPDMGQKAYCLGHDFFDEHSPCPYTVYSVETGEVVSK